VSAAPRTLVVDLAATSRNWSLPADGAARLADEAARLGWTIRFVTAPAISDGDGATAPSAEAREAMQGAEAYFGFGMSRALFVEAPALRWVHSASAGVTAALFPEMLASPAVLTNSAGIHAETIAQHVIGGIIYLLRGFDIAVDQQRRAEWNKGPFVNAGARVREIRECRVVIVGTGGIGGAIGRHLAHFGARCTGVRRRPELGAPDGFARVVGPDSLGGELGAADLLILAAPLTPATQALIGAGELDALPAEAIVVNVARGTLLDEGALAERVESGRLRGAVLDVFREEPLDAGSPLWSLRSVLLTPHVSSVSPALFWDRELDLFTDNWRRWDRGEPLRNVVDKSAGY